VAATGAAWS
jgi:hypothetical protein